MDKLAIGLEIIKKLNAYSYQAYIVGGAVRDYVRGEAITDVDITTSASPQNIAELFAEVSLEGKDYLSCRIHMLDYIFEVTSFRKDCLYTDHRHPVAIPAETLEEDLERRDFTMNALAMDENKKIIDLFEGVKDIKEKTIRTIGDPKKRFAEDGLRVLRALDFASRFSYRLNEDILDSLTEDYLKYLKEEYILAMVTKICRASSYTGLEYIAKYNILRSFPFYQVACEEVLFYGYTNFLALFYVLHNFLPKNIRISNKDHEVAKEIAYYVRNEFNQICLYYGNPSCLEEAVCLYNCLHKTKLSIKEIEEKVAQLPIRSAKDIRIDWTKINPIERSSITKKLEYEIVMGNLLNEQNHISKFLEIEE